MAVFNNILAGSSGQTTGGYEIERSLRFNPSDSASLTKTFSATGSQTTYTFSFWLKKNNSSSVYQNIFIDNDSSSSQIRINDTTGGFELRFAAAGASAALTTNRKFRDPSAWYHIVCVYDSTNATSSDRMRIYVNGIRETSFLGEQQPTQNLTSAFITNGHTYTIGYFASNTALDGYLADIHFIDGQALDPTSFGEPDDNGVWQPIDASGLTYGTNGFHLPFSDNSTAAALGTDTSGNGNDWAPNNFAVSTNPIYSNSLTTNGAKTGWFTGTPPNAFDGSVSTNVGGALGGDITFAPAAAIPVVTSLKIWADSGSGFGVGNGPYQIIYNGTQVYNSSMWAAGYEITAAAGTSLSSLVLDQSGSGETMRIFKIEIDGVVLINGAGAGNDSLVDSPTNGSQTDTGVGSEVVGNYCVWNPLDKGSGVTASNGNLDASCATTGINGTTALPASSEYYFEITYNSIGSDADTFAGLMYLRQASGVRDLTAGGTRLIVRANAGVIYNDSTTTATTAFSAGDVLGVAVDCGANSVQFYRNGSTIGSAQTPSTAIDGSNWVPWCGTSSSTSTFTLNAGQRAFAYPAPSGFKALCTTNLPEPTIADGSTVMDVLVFAATNANNTSITGLNFQPDLVWGKSRTNAYGHQLYDSVRGVNKSLKSNTTDAEGTDTNGVTSFDSNGFTAGVDFNAILGSGSSVAWTWDAGSSNTTIAAGGLNSSLYDQSQTWSNFVTGTAYSGYPITNAFDGDTSTRSLESGSTGHTFTPPSALTVNSTLRVYLQYADSSATNALKVNGTDKSSLITTTGSNLGWLTIPGITSITSLFWGVSPAGAETCSISAIEVDGKLLVDSGVTPPNVPSIASTVRANPSAGFSIVTYTGTGSAATVGHGLGVAPALIIVKNRTTGTNWETYHRSTGATKKLELNETSAAGTNSNTWNNTEPTSSVFTVGTNNSANGATYVAYCFAPVEGYSAFNSYTGNGSTDGPFVYTGFRPRWILTKTTNGVNHWDIYDAARDSYNVADAVLKPNLANGESTLTGFDLLSNGFKARGTDSENNGSGDTYIYAAFAEHPFAYARAR